MKDSDWQILYELHKTPNITKVANRLYITQPSLTKRLQNMEEEFQIKIVTRTTKGVEFTKEGELLVQKAEQYISFMQQLRKELRDLQDDKKDIIVIGASYTYSKYVLSDILYQYAKEHPNVGFDVQNDQSNLLFRKVCDGDVDVAFVRGDYDGPVVQHKIDVSQAYILSKDPVNMEELPNMQRIGYKTNDRSREMLNRWWDENYGGEMPAGMSAGYVDVAWQLASHGLGYVCCFLSEDYDKGYELTETPIYYADGTPVTRNTWFAYKEKKEMSKSLKKFIKYINETIVM
ncbi:MAG: LysR family transcriptional regulator [Lachnospiraceae bacterium]